MFGITFSSPDALDYAYLDADGYECMAPVGPRMAFPSPEAARSYAAGRLAHYTHSEVWAVELGADGEPLPGGHHAQLNDPEASQEGLDWEGGGDGLCPDCRMCYDLCDCYDD